MSSESLLFQAISTWQVERNNNPGNLETLLAAWISKGGFGLVRTILNEMTTWSQQVPIRDTSQIAAASWTVGHLNIFLDCFEQLLDSQLQSVPGEYPYTKDSFIRDEVQSSLAAAFLGVVKDVPKESILLRETAALLWLQMLNGVKIVANNIENPQFGLDSYSRIIPSESGDRLAWGPAQCLAEAERFLESVEGVATGRRSGIHFPTALPKGNDYLPGVLFEMRGTVIEEESYLSREWKFADESEKARACLLAPWSIYGLKEDRIENIFASADVRNAIYQPPTFRGRGNASENSSEGNGSISILVELHPVYTHGNEWVERNPFTTVDGTSISLAFCLAAWASRHKLLLRPLCCTAEVSEEVGASLISVDAVKEKMTLVHDYFIGRGRSCSIACHPVDLVVASDVLGNSHLIKYTKTEQGRAPESLSDLLTNYWQLLLNSFDDFRNAYLAWFAQKELRPTNDDGRQGWQPTIEELVRAPGKVQGVLDLTATNPSETTPPPSVIGTSDFNGDSSPLALDAVCHLAKAVGAKEAEKGGAGISADLGISFLLPLQDLNSPEQLKSAIRAGLDKFYLGKTDQAQSDARKDPRKDEWNRSILPDDLLANLLGPDREKLWLVVYDAASLEMALYDEGGAGVLKKFLDEPGKGQPKVFFVASDYHHQLFLDETFINPKPEAAETSKR